MSIYFAFELHCFYLVRCCLELDASDLRDFGRNFDIEPLLGVQTL